MTTLKKIDQLLIIFDTSNDAFIYSPVIHSKNDTINLENQTNIHKISTFIKDLSVFKSSGPYANNDDFNLSSPNGIKIWDESFVYSFIKHNPSKSYEICKKYSELLISYGNYEKYEPYFGFGSFYEDIIDLSNSHSGVVLDLAQQSIHYIIPPIINNYIPLSIPLEIIHIIIKYLLTLQFLPWESHNGIQILFLDEITQVHQTSPKKSNTIPSSYREPLEPLPPSPPIYETGQSIDHVSSHFYDRSTATKLMKYINNWHWENYGPYGRMEKCILSSPDGLKMWNDSFIFSFIKYKSEKAYEIAMRYSWLLSTHKTYEQYEKEYGFGSFYEEIVILSNNDGGMVKHLCETAVDDILPVIVNGYINASIEDKLPLGIIKLIINNLICIQLLGKQLDHVQTTPIHVPMYKSEKDYPSKCWKCQYGEVFLLTCDVGRRLWDECRVYFFVKFAPQKVWEMFEYHTPRYKHYLGYKEYEEKYGFGSFYEEILRLAYTDGHIVVNLCRDALEFTNNRIVKGYLPKYMPLDVINLVLSCFIDYQCFENYVKSDYVKTIYRLGDYRGCMGINEFEVEKEEGVVSWLALDEAWELNEYVL